MDDYKDFRVSLRRSLLTLGAKSVDITEEANDAIAKVSTKQYDVILCDYNLGEEKKDGHQIFEELAYKNKIGYSTMFMMITAENTINLVMGVMDYQPDGYLIKPFTTKELVARIKATEDKKHLFAGIDAVMRRKDFKEAIALCDDLLQKNPRYRIDILKVKGEVYMTSGDYKNAEDVYALVLTTHKLPWASFNMGKVYFHTKRFQDAADTFKALITENDKFIPVYDWYAKALDELGEKSSAQDVLHKAVSLSPKAIFRQRALGNIAFTNTDFNTAESSFKKAIKLGKTSIFKDSSDYTQLAKVFVNKKETAKALDMVKDVMNDFAENDEVLLQATLLKSHIYAETKESDKSMASLKEAEDIYKKLGGKVAPQLAIEIAQSFIENNEKDKGMELMKYIVRNNFSDNNILTVVQDTFKDLGMAVEGAAFVSETKAEIVGTNNRGVEFIDKGMLTEAIDLFEKAADGLPSNFTINFNALKAIIGFLQKNGRDDRYLFKCEKYISRLNEIEPDNNKYLQLVDKYKSIKSSDSGNVDLSEML
ncbi:response regulator [Candidatus Magnetomonas plexicatena]|uniref:response regulator n=1 Tax=Candidatus Magnetomonas plexicatena TaxID=2552947 RepID=UPI004032F93F